MIETCFSIFNSKQNTDSLIYQVGAFQDLLVARNWATTIATSHPSVSLDWLPHLTHGPNDCPSPTPYHTFPSPPLSSSFTHPPVPPFMSLYTSWSVSLSRVKDLYQMVAWLPLCSGEYPWSVSPMVIKGKKRRLCHIPCTHVPL